MDLELSKEDLAFRDEVRAFLQENLTADIKDGAKVTSAIRSDFLIASRWAKILADKGWLAHTWPAEHGGPGWNVVQRYIYDYECAMAGTPSLYSMGTRMIGPAIMKFGNDQQKEFYLSKILSDEDTWCQGYSEPGAGSDLASLQTRAISDGDDYIVNGSKIWTTGAHNANRIFCLVRTSTEGKRQEGISFLLIDMDAPGIKVDPIIMFSGDHELNQVFFDDVRVPKANRIGEENDGWTVAKYLLEFERGGNAFTPPLKAALHRLLKMAQLEPEDGAGKLIDDPSFRGQIAELEVLTTAAEMTEKRIFSEMSTGQNPGPASSMFKLRGSEIQQRIMDLGMQAIGYYASVYQPDAYQPGRNVEPIAPEHGLVATQKYFNLRAATIYAGSSEVQRSVIAKQVLRL